MPDRPAAELLADWMRPFGRRTAPSMEYVLERLVRAEQALAAVSVLTDKYGEHGYTRIEQDLRAALRASQGGQ